MALFIAVKNKPEVLQEEAEKYGGTVLHTQSSGDEEVAVVKFDDESAGSKFGISLNGTNFRAEWAAKYHADTQLR